MTKFANEKSYGAMAGSGMCAGRLPLISPVAPQNYLQRPRKFVLRSPISLQALKNAECLLFFTKPPLAFSRAGNGRKFKFGLVAPLSAISLPSIGSGMSVLQAASKISVNLIAICIFVAWLQKSGQLPTETSTVLSQAAFRLTIPCFLMSKVSKTIAFQPQGILLSIPIIGMLQILVGTMLGKALVKLIQKDKYLIPVNASDGPLCMRQLSERDEMLAKDDAIIIASCAFGNSITLPLVILSGILPPKEASTAAGFVALFVVGWSPFLWSYGYQMFNTTYGQGPSSDRDTNRSFLQLCRIWIQHIMNPPLYGVLMGIIIGGTPLASVFFPSKPGTVSGFFGKTDGPLVVLYLGITAFLQSVWEAASLLGSASVAMQAIVLACSVAPFVPLFGIDKKIPNGDQESEKSLYGGDGENGTISQFVLDSQVFWAISCVRLLAMPLAGLLIVKTLHWADILPSDPICILTILVLSAMPTAQNIVVLLQLRTSTRPLAGVLADLLVRQYALSLVSVPLWITAFTAVIPLM